MMLRCSRMYIIQKSSAECFSYNHHYYFSVFGTFCQRALTKVPQIVYSLLRNLSRLLSTNVFSILIKIYISTPITTSNIYCCIYTAHYVVQQHMKMRK
jgi:hypothetical protein